jgi:hypothetical protein
MKIKACTKLCYCLLILVLKILPLFTIGQTKKPSDQPLRFEGSIQSGLFFDLFYANIAFSWDASDLNPLSYSNVKGKRAQLGKMDRVEIKYLFNAKSAISFNFSNALWKDLYGTGNDPLEAWTETRRYNRRMQFSANYYRIFPAGKKAQWSIASGFQVQLEKISFPFYRTEDPNDPTRVTFISAGSRLSYFEDWAIPITVAYHWKINKNLHLGFMMHTGYTAYIGVEGIALMGSIAIPFGNPIPLVRVRRNNKQP